MVRLIKRTDKNDVGAVAGSSDLAGGARLDFEALSMGDRVRLRSDPIREIGEVRERLAGGFVLVRFSHAREISVHASDVELVGPDRRRRPRHR